MTRRWLLAGVALTLCATTALRAQARTTLSLIPVGGIQLPMGDFVKDPDFKLTPRFGVFVGALAELTMNKNISFFGEASRTLGATQKLEASFPSSGGDKLTTDMATTQLAAGLIFRPLGRLPSGAPKSVYFEAGGGFTMYSVSAGFQDPSAQNDLNFSGNSPFVMGGLGISCPAGPRASVQISGRVRYQVSAYDSDAIAILEDPGTGFGHSLAVEKPLWFQLGIGLRIGR